MAVGVALVSADWVAFASPREALTVLFSLLHWSFQCPSVFSN
jgi:hypothetical protein